MTRPRCQVKNRKAVDTGIRRAASGGMDLRTTIHAEISDGAYVCLVCHSEVTAKSPIWTCHSCFRSFDVSCIRDWSKRDSAKSAQWRCPHCLGPQSQKPSAIRYRCWCGKVANPHKSVSSNDPWEAAVGATTGAIPPHSCGQTCGAKRDCPHPCPLVCHAGPHADSAQCMYQGPKIKCFCGKTMEQRLCSESRYGGFSCGSPCDRTHARCGHKCSRACHKTTTGRNKSTSCGPCKAKVKVTCFCGKIKSSKRKCESLSGKDRKNIKTHWKNKTEGQISCGKPCSMPLKCGHHKCELACHAPEDAEHECPLEPFEGETCFCGKTIAHRTKCTDAKLRCENLCGKKLECGHACTARCHDGPCEPCGVIVPDVRCRCKRTTRAAKCHEARHNPPQCTTPCWAMLSCRRHKCTRQCCEFAPKKQQSQSSQRKKRTFTLEELLQNGGRTLPEHAEAPISEAEEAAHLCIRVCGKTLGCGIHTCVQPCHAGACPSCLAASFEEWSCPCGRTKVEPPIRCGTVMPRCDYLCHRSQRCGHKAQHACHDNAIPCGPCMTMVQTSCRCGKYKMPMPCSQVNSDRHVPPLCMEPCNRKLKCGHVCKKNCCEGGDACIPCTALCGRKFEACGHEHKIPCHSPDPCPEQCDSTLIATCPCGVLKLRYQCGEDMEIGCNDVCVRESYPLPVLDAYEEDKVWCTTVEVQLRAFISQNPTSQTYWFKPMSRQRRRFVYFLLEHYGMDGQSMDEGAKRSICAYRTKNTWLPSVRLSQARRARPQTEIDIGEDLYGLDPEVSSGEGALSDGLVPSQESDDTCATSEDGWKSMPLGQGGNSEADVENSKKPQYSALSRSFSVLTVD